MNLSKKNIEKLCMSGIYSCMPVLSWIPSYKRDTPYHCINWTFKVMESKGKYYMNDTYWSGYDGLRVELTDDNFDNFEFLFDLNEVSKVSPPDFYDYDEADRWHVALDSGGYKYNKYYYVRKGAKKNKTILLERLNRELESLKREVEWKKEEIRKVEEGAE